MKGIFIISLLLSVGLLSACDDMLDMTPENSLTFKNAYETEKDIESAVRLCAQKLRDVVGVDGNIGLGTVLDSTIYSDYEGQRNLRPQFVRESDWFLWYELIGATNVVIKYTDQIDASRERKDYYLGQGHFYRAFAYFQIVQGWGDCVIVGLDADMEIVRPQSPWVEVIDYAINEAREAVRLLPEYDKVKNSSGNSPLYKNEPCKGAANALLAYLCAWKAGGKYYARPDLQGYDENDLWREAEQACTAIIGSETGKAGGIYQLVENPEAVINKVFKGNSSESVFELQYDPYWDEIERNENYKYYKTAGDGRAARYCTWLQYMRFYGLGLDCIKEQRTMVKAERIKEMYPKGDLRRESYFWKLDSMSHDTLLNVTGGFAYPYAFRDMRTFTSGDDKGKFAHFDCNYTFWRLADIHLLRAECRVRLNKEAEAIADLNEVRKRANAKLYDPAEYNGDLRYAIFKEREKELFFESHRYFDIIRNGADYVRKELDPGFAEASDQDFIDGCFFYALKETAFGRNTGLRQNTWWNRYL
ncbi:MULTISPECIES: RagB/SusD family nutrient uptake outer membrane protein [Butyricimonas]|uniref:RagB/SusD family nutrient uptake outer membrane protein n=1 Tax=Butyricimonas TaxID=574697 RepID=UPI0007FB32D2|nr:MULTISPECIES: RagB/SusD family nutrient uptake outer membrane protein [Butyricimonas]